MALTKSLSTWSSVGITTLTFTSLPVHLKVDRNPPIKNHTTEGIVEWMKEEKFMALCHVSPWG